MGWLDGITNIASKIDWNDIKGAASLVSDFASASAGIKSAKVAQNAIKQSSKMYDDQVQKLKTVKLNLDGATRSTFGYPNKKQDENEKRPTIYIGN